jgi:hypothetical protein
MFLNLVAFNSRPRLEVDISGADSQSDSYPNATKLPAGVPVRNQLRLRLTDRCVGVASRVSFPM